MGEGWRALGVGHYTENLGGESELGPVEGDNIFVGWAADLEGDFGQMYCWRKQLQFRRRGDKNALTVSVPEPSGFVVSKVIVNGLFRSLEVELGVYRPGLRYTSVDPVSMRSTRFSPAPTVKLANQNPFVYVSPGFIKGPRQHRPGRQTRGSR